MGKWVHQKKYTTTLHTVLESFEHHRLVICDSVTGRLALVDWILVGQSQEWDDTISKTQVEAPLWRSHGLGRGRHITHIMPLSLQSQIICGLKPLIEDWRDCIPRNRSQDPCELSHLCRAVIRRSLLDLSLLPAGISALPLPLQIQNYLNLEWWGPWPQGPLFKTWQLIKWLMTTKHMKKTCWSPGVNRFASWWSEIYVWIEQILWPITRDWLVWSWICLLHCLGDLRQTAYHVFKVV